MYKIPNPGNLRDLNTHGLLFMRLALGPCDKLSGILFPARVCLGTGATKHTKLNLLLVEK